MKKAVLCTVLIPAFLLTACSASVPAADNSTADVQITDSTEPAASAAEENSDDDALVQAAIGTWEFEESDGIPSLLIIKGRNEAYIKVTVESDELYFDKDRNLYVLNKKFSKNDYDFQDGILSLFYQEKCILVMKKTDDSDDLFGDYLLTGGKFTERFTKDTGENLPYVIGDITANMQENKTCLSMLSIQDGFELKDGRITKLKDGKVCGKSKYRIEGDKMIITGSEGEEQIMTRIE